MKELKTGITAAFITIFGWSLAGIFINLLPNLNALLIVAIRLFISLIIVFPIMLFMKKNILIYLKELNNLTTWMLGLILFFCYFLGTLAFQMAPVGEVTILMTISPLFVILFKFLVGDTVKKFEVIGVVVSLIGVFLITFNQLSFEQSSSKNRLIGNLLAVMGSILFAIYAIWYKVLNQKDKAPDTLSVAMSTFIIGSILLIIMVFKSIAMINTIEFDYLSIFYLIGISIVSTAIPTISYTVSSKYLSPILTTSILLLQPFLAIIFAMLFINEIPNLLVIPGFIFILVGLTMIMKTNK